ncbi:hypothetical protein [Marinithermofilum abyssi]|uniref:hypothetical protein n=1 Tax=Marinithermofilum abyssi TaxID=1571185 RepID=UPI001668B4F1|nr:hypothetical protein [Marinithermofilum abyssi]
MEPADPMFLLSRKTVHGRFLGKGRMIHPWIAIAAIAVLTAAELIMVGLRRASTPNWRMRGRYFAVARIFPVVSLSSAYQGERKNIRHTLVPSALCVDTP